MADISIATKSLTREKLARFLPNHEAIIAFESLIRDVNETLPNSLTEAKTAADNAQSAADASQQVASIAMGIADMLSSLISAVEQAESTVSQLREELATLSRRIDSLELKP